MDAKAGVRFKSAVCTTEVVVVRPPSGPVDLRCGGVPMLGPEDATPPESPSGPLPEHDGGTLLGKRYTDDDAAIEVLCTKAGAGALSCDGRMLAVKGAKPLPASD